MALEARNRCSRRALLAGAIGAIGSAATATVAGAQRVLAAGSDGETVVIGGDYPDVRSWTRYHSVLHDVSERGPGLEFHHEADNGDEYRRTKISGGGITQEINSSTWYRLWTTTIGAGIRVEGGKEQSPAIVARTSVGPAIVGETLGEGVGVRGTGGEVGVRGHGAYQGSRGGVFSGDVAQVRLVASRAGSHPRSGATGDLFVDSQKRLWFCRAGRSWVRLA